MQVARDESRDIVGGRNQRSRAHGTTLGMGARAPRARKHHAPQRAAAARPRSQEARTKSSFWKVVHIWFFEVSTLFRSFLGRLRRRRCRDPSEIAQLKRLFTWRTHLSLVVCMFVGVKRRL